MRAAAFALWLTWALGPFVVYAIARLARYRRPWPYLASALAILVPVAGTILALAGIGLASRLRLAPARRRPPRAGRPGGVIKEPKGTPYPEGPDYFGRNDDPPLWLV